MKAEIPTGIGCVARGYKYTSLEILNIRQSVWMWMAEGKPLKEVEGTPGHRLRLLWCSELNFQVCQINGAIKTLL